MKRSNAVTIGVRPERKFKRRAILITEGVKIEIGYFNAFIDSTDAFGINDRSMWSCCTGSTRTSD